MKSAPVPGLQNLESPDRQQAVPRARPDILAFGLSRLRTRGLASTSGDLVAWINYRWCLRRASQAGSGRLWGRIRIVNRGTITLGHRLRLDGRTVRLELVATGGGTISIGDSTYVNYGTNISATNSVTIGANCAIGQYAIIMDNDYHSVANHHAMGESAPIVIGDDVWLGARVIVLRGANIGNGCVIGANSVVKGTIPAYSLAAGSPARVIRSLTRTGEHEPRRP